MLLAVAQLLILLTLANGSPVVAKLVLRDRFSLPLDGNRKFIDGRPLLGRAKTIRGILVAIMVTTASAPLIGLDLGIGSLVGATAMAGDLLVELSQAPPGSCPQQPSDRSRSDPESLFPLLACRQALT